jgi:cAMP-dependent protein kinase regulator
MRLRKHKDEGAPTTSAAAPGQAELTYLELGFAKVPIFSACTPDQLLRLASLTVLRDATAGEAVVTEGEPGDAFFVILHGEAVVTRHGTEVARLGPGDFFGELALFDPAPRNATVAAENALSLAVLSKRAFREALEEAPFRENVFLGMARRLHHLDAGV